MSYPEIPPVEIMTQEEQRAHLATAAFQLAEIWSFGVSDRLSIRERVHGAVHGMLNLLENGGEGVPAFHLAPVLSEEHSSMTEVFRGDGMVEADWDHGVMMNLQGPEEIPSTTQLYQSIYDNHRERYTIAARELFG